MPVRLGLVVFVLDTCSMCKDYLPRLKVAAAGLPLDVRDAASKMAEKFGVKYAPTTLVVSKLGVHSRVESALSNEEIVKFLAPVRKANKISATSRR